MEVGDTVQRRFEMVSVPTEITSPEARAEYLAQHYWDRFDFSDAAYFHLPEVTEQALVDFVDLMRYVSREVAATAVRGMMQRAAADSTAFVCFADLYEKYLYDADSPMRDEELFIPVLEALTEAPFLSEVDKVRPEYMLRMALKNRVGKPAADFSYMLSDGSTATLRGTEADLLLLLFYDPDCHTCHETLRQLSLSPLVTRLQREKGMKILAVYTGDALDLWRSNIPNIPKEWINAYDGSMSIWNDELYDLKSLPALYLLDKEKNVVLKDVSPEVLTEYLRSCAD